MSVSAEHRRLYRQRPEVRERTRAYAAKRRARPEEREKRRAAQLIYNRTKRGIPIDEPLRRVLGRPCLHHSGYLYITVDGESVAQHRHVMSQTLGRPLFKHESVHHLNGVKTDNRPENLELWTKSQPPGQRVADKIAWAKEILRQYGETL